MTATAARPRPRKTTEPVDPLDGIPCCQGCGAVLFEDLLGRLRCLIPDCGLHGQVAGHTEVDVGTLTPEAIDG